jgi:hypothetical protein
MRHSLSDLKKERIVIPDLSQGICLRMAKDQFRDDFPYSTKGIGTICKNTDDSKDSAAAAAIAVITKHPAKGSKSKRMVVVKF